MPPLTNEEKKHKKRQHLKRCLWCAVIADDAFKRAKATAEHYIKEGYSMEHPLHYTFLSSIVVTYCKLFTGANKLPPLPDKFTKFDDKELKSAHDALMLARNNIYAHSDITFANYSLQINLRWEGDKVFAKAVGKAPHLNAVVIPQVVRLCDIQIHRAKDYTHNTVGELLPPSHMRMLLETEKTDSTSVSVLWPKITDSPKSW